MTGGPELIPQLLEDALKSEKKDLQHKRLAQYRVLEEKHQAKKAFSSNEEFLYQSNIRVDIETDAEDTPIVSSFVFNISISGIRNIKTTINADGKQYLGKEEMSDVV